jgi:hypothetical protein
MNEKYHHHHQRRSLPNTHIMLPVALCTKQGIKE